MVESRSVKRNAKNTRGLGRDRVAEALSSIFPATTAPFPKSCVSYFHFVCFNTFLRTILSESLAQASLCCSAWYRFMGPLILKRFGILNRVAILMHFVLNRVSAPTKFPLNLPPGEVSSFVHKHNSAKPASPVFFQVKNAI